MHKVMRRKVNCALIDAWRVLASALSTAVVDCCTTGSPEEVGAMLGGTKRHGLEMEVGKTISG